MANLLLSEPEFELFRQYCREKGFDLSYYELEISGSRSELERYSFDGPRVIKIKKRWSGFEGTPYDVPVWQRDKWRSSFNQIKDDFLQRKAAHPVLSSVG